MLLFNFFLIIYMYLTFIFMFMKHPLSMGMILLAQSITVALMTGFMNTSFWMSYILFLVMVGGMLILFLYMTNIASNKKFKFNLMWSMIFPFFLPFILMNFNINQNFINLSKMFNFPSLYTMILMIIYLFVTMVATVKITSHKMGPFRKF